MARTLANIKKTHFRVLHRTPEAFTIPESAAAFATFLATFTELGYCRDKTIKSTIEPAESEVLDDGSKLAMGWNGKLEGILLQSEVGDYTAYEAIENVAQDILIYDETNLRCRFFPNALLVFNEAVESGGVESIPFSYEKSDMPEKSDFRTYFAESEVI